METSFDEFIDYKSEYSQRLQKVKFRGAEILSLCPFHGDTNPSFSVNLKNGKYNCFSCGASGNYVRFRSQTDNIDMKAAYKKICEENGIEQKPAYKQEKKAGTPILYTLSQYAAEKMIPSDWLEQYCRLSAASDKDGTGYIRIPYFDIGSTGEATFRKRYHKEHTPRFKWKYGVSIPGMYGEWRISTYNSEVILVEGESDSQTLWYLGYPALGVPGANNYKAEWTDRLEKFETVYIHVEPDMGGETFLAQMMAKLKQGGYGGKVLTFTCKEHGVKDPSDLYIEHGFEETKTLLDSLLKNAKPIDISKPEVVKLIEDAPIHLRSPQGWIFGNNGIVSFGANDKVVNVCRTPIIITRRLKSLDTGEEKIEISFKRDGRWHSGIFSRTTIFQSKNIVSLADMGCTITSENAKKVVSFLSALEAENFDSIDITESTSTFGWQTKERFLPGCADDILIDVEPSMQKWVDGYKAQGKLADWIEGMRGSRNKSLIFRFILAAGFAAPLIRVLKSRSFMVYNWADSKSGKTAALKAALSIWGRPEKTMATFNATQVALERMAGIFNDLPMGLDERQLAGSKTEFIDKLVYMLSNGAGRIRGSKTGQLQSFMQWRSIIMATGEEPIISDKSMDGVASRMIEICGSPFEVQDEAAAMHRATAENFGLAGPAFVQWLIKVGDKRVNEYYQYVEAMLKSNVQRAGLELDGNRLAMMAVITLADALSSKLFWDREINAMELMKASVECSTAVAHDVTLELKGGSTNENAADFINSWLIQKQANFSESLNMKADWYGFVDEHAGWAYVLAPILREALEDAGYSYRKTMKYLGDNGFIQRSKDDRTAIPKKHNGRLMRMVAININKLIDTSDMDISEEGEEIHDATNPHFD